MYNVLLNGVVVAEGLSNGELNQFLLDIFSESKYTKENLIEAYKSFGFEERNFEDFIYNNEIKTPLDFSLGNDQFSLKEG